MQRLLVPALFVFLDCLAAAAPLTTSAVSAAAPAAPTFNKDVLPILQKNCQECHRPGAIAPMSFLTFTGYASVRARHREGGRRQDDAAVVCGSGDWALRECEGADRRRDRDVRRVG